MITGPAGTDETGASTKTVGDATFGASSTTSLVIISLVFSTTASGSVVFYLK